jgi:hypothetical protein
MRRLAMARAGNRELAEDALQETYWAVGRVKDPGRIQDLRAFFCRALIREINHQRGRSSLVPVEDGETTPVQGRGSSFGSSPPASVENQAALRLLTERMLHRLEHDHDELMASVPGRSPDHHRYQAVVVASARTILLLLLEGSVTSADWNAALRSEYPQWCGGPGQARDAIDQRLNRARRDMKLLLQEIFSRHELSY